MSDPTNPFQNRNELKDHFALKPTTPAGFLLEENKRLRAENDTLRRERDEAQAQVTAAEHLILCRAETITFLEGERDAAIARAEKVEQERVEARGVLSALALYLSVGSGDDSTSAEEYEQRIRDGLDLLVAGAVKARDAALARAHNAEAKAMGYLSMRENCKRHYDHMLARLEETKKEMDEWKETAEHLLNIEQEWIDENNRLGEECKKLAALLREAVEALEDARTAILHKCSPADDIDIAIDAIDAVVKEDGE